MRGKIKFKSRMLRVWSSNGYKSVAWQAEDDC
jgi:hypothetical protein